LHSVVPFLLLSHALSPRYSTFISCNDIYIIYILVEYWRNPAWIVRPEYIPPLIHVIKDMKVRSGLSSNRRRLLQPAVHSFSFCSAFLALAITPFRAVISQHERERDREPKWTTIGHLQPAGREILNSTGPTLVKQEREAEPLKPARPKPFWGYLSASSRVNITSAPPQGKCTFRRSTEKIWAFNYSKRAFVSFPRLEAQLGGFWRSHSSVSSS